MLAGADKDAKQKIDALAKDAQTKNAAAAADLNLLLQDPNSMKDPRTIMTAEARSVHEVTRQNRAGFPQVDARPAPYGSPRPRRRTGSKQDDAAKPPPRDPNNWNKHGPRKGPGAPGGGRDEKPAEPDKVKADF